MNPQDVRTRPELPTENVNGEPIEYVWIVYRPAANSQLGEAELLGAHDNAESAKKHAANANRAGEVEIEAMNIQGEGSALARAIGVE